MAILKIARAGHPIIRRPADPVPVEEITSPEVQRIIDDMLHTVDDADGAGLAAPQVHISKRIVVLTIDDERGMEVWINPVLTPLSEDQLVTYEGCLSVPGLRGAVPRPAKVSVEAYDREGQALSYVLEDFPAVVAQHECDHLDGVLYIDKALTQTISFIEEYRRYGTWALRAMHDTLDEYDELHEDLEE